MPIEVSELLKHPLPLDEKIVEFLAKEPQKAFSLDEIYAGVQGVTVTFARLAGAVATLAGNQAQQEFQEYRTTLAVLIQQGRVKSAMHGGEHYYYAGEGLP